VGAADHLTEDPRRRKDAPDPSQCFGRSTERDDRSLSITAIADFDGDLIGQAAANVGRRLAAAA
jgi:hypothetical protein